MILEDATRRGVPVLIPGANELRVRTPAVELSATTREPIPVLPPSDAAGGRAQLENEREGGGAPGQRRRASQKTVVARLRQWLFLLLTFAVFPAIMGFAAAQSPSHRFPEVRRCSS